MSTLNPDEGDLRSAISALHLTDLNVDANSNVALLALHAPDVLARIVAQCALGEALQDWWKHYLDRRFVMKDSAISPEAVGKLTSAIEMIPTVLKVVETVSPSAKSANRYFYADRLLKEVDSFVTVFPEITSWDEKRALAIVVGITPDIQKIGSPVFFANIRYISQNLPSVIDLLPELNARQTLDHTVIKEMLNQPPALREGML